MPKHASRAKWISELTDAGERDPDHDVGQRAERDEAAAQEYPSHCLASLFPASPGQFIAANSPVSALPRTLLVQPKCVAMSIYFNFGASVRRCGTERQTPKFRFQKKSAAQAYRSWKDPGAGDFPPLALSLLKVAAVATHTPSTTSNAL
jgi:hypothetical protein